jgi:hypothetical protein
MPKSDFARLFGVSESQLERHFQKGMPHEKKGRAVSIPMPAGRVWLHEHIFEKGKKLAAPKNIADAVQRREMARAQLEELKLAREQGKTMLVEQAEKQIADAFARVRAKLLNFPTRGAAAAFGASSIQMCKAKLEPLILEMLEELSAAADVPEDDAA